MAQLPKRISSGISKGIFGAIALSLTFGAVASGRDLGQQDAAGRINSVDASAAVINRSRQG